MCAVACLLAGWLGVSLPLAALAGIFGFATLAAVLLADRVWIANGADAISHAHPELSPDHPHLAEHGAHHSPAIVIDDLHPRWPQRPA